MATKTKNNMYEVLFKVWQELPDYLKKDGYNKMMKYNYISERKIKELINPLFKKYGIIFKVDVSNPNIVPIGEKGRVLTTVTVKYAFVLAEDPETKIEGEFIGQGVDNGDKGVYKAITGAIKYIIMSLFLIPTGDDPENDEEPVKTRRTAVKPVNPAIENAKNISRRLYTQLKKVDPEKATLLATKYKGKLTTLEAINLFNTEMQKAIEEAKVPANA